MAPYASSLSSDSEDEDAPEAFSLVQSKQAAKSQNDALRRAEAAAKEKKKERNRQTDRKLKERALLTGRGKKSAMDENDVQTRMERAMRNAEQESEETGEDSEGGSGSDDDMGESQESSEDEDEDMLVGEEDAEEDDGLDDIDNDPLSPAKTNPRHLPDHLFTAAFAPKPQSKVPSNASRKLDLVKKRKNHKRAKDLIVGSRTVRALSNPSRAGSHSASKTMPSSKANKFVNRSLGLKGGKARTKGWERRPANIGVLRTSEGPAVGFVRAR